MPLPAVSGPTGTAKQTRLEVLQMVPCPGRRKQRAETGLWE